MGAGRLGNADGMASQSYCAASSPGISLVIGRLAPSSGLTAYLAASVVILNDDIALRRRRLRFQFRQTRFERLQFRAGFR